VSGRSLCGSSASEFSEANYRVAHSRRRVFATGRYCRWQRDNPQTSSDSKCD
jgi:hypothetical protein